MNLKQSLSLFALSTFLGSALATPIPSWRAQINIPEGEIAQISYEGNVNISQTSNTSFSIQPKITCMTEQSTEDEINACAVKNNATISLAVTNNGEKCSIELLETYFATHLAVTHSTCDGLNEGEMLQLTNQLEYSISEEYTNSELPWLE